MRLAVLVVASACSFRSGAPSGGPGDAARDARPTVDVSTVDAFPSDLVAYYKMDELAAIIDATGRGHDGTCTSCPTQAFGVVGDAYDFVNERFDVAAAPDLQTESGTVATWFELDTLPTTSYACLVNAYLPGGGGADTWQICYAGPTSSWEVYLAATPFNFGTSTTIAALEWHHLALTWTPSSAALYVDGAQVISTSCTPLEFAPAGSFTFGSDRDDNGDNDAPFPGKLDELRLYDDALAPPQIAALATL
jgi:hypothetical protein